MGFCHFSTDRKLHLLLFEPCLQKFCNLNLTSNLHVYCMFICMFIDSIIIKLAVLLLVFLMSTLLSLRTVMKMQISQPRVLTIYKTLTVLGAAIEGGTHKIWIITTEGKNMTYRRPTAHNFYTWTSERNLSPALPTLFLRPGELFCKENKRAIENSSVSRERRFSNEILKILPWLNKLFN